MKTLNPGTSNNVQFQTTQFDLRMTFGEFDLANMSVQQHTAMTVSWLQAKLMHYFLTLQLAVYEMSNGKIGVPPDALPPEPQPPTGDLKDNPAAIEVYEYIKKARQQFIESLK